MSETEYCRKCGVDIRSNADICARCGYPPSSLFVEREALNFCDKCGKAVKKGDKKCENCGRSLNVWP
jgi:uncharacterized membrane protein YvbJ